MAGGAKTPNIAVLAAIARLGTCGSARGSDADRRVNLLIQFAMEGSLRTLIHTFGFASHQIGARRTYLCNDLPAFGALNSER
jgi:hypothetical protein